MNILIIAEIDWIKKTTYEMHHLSELYSLKKHNVYAIDIQDPGIISTTKSCNLIKNYHRVYNDATVTLFRTPIIPIKGLHRIAAYMSKNFIKKILKEKKIDFVLMYSVVNNSQAAIKACKEMKIPIIHRTFDIADQLIKENYLRKIVLWVEKKIYPQFDLVIANTPYTKKWAESMGAKNITLISQGVDPNLMKPFPKNIELQNELGIKDDDIVVMYLGTILPFDGLDILFQQIPKIIKKIPKFKMLIVGGGEHLENLKHLSKKLRIDKQVIFMDWQPYSKVPQFCSLAKICVNTFQTTKMTDKLSPVKIFDLLACAKPVLATPLKGLMYDLPADKGIIKYANLDDFHKMIINMIEDKNIQEIGDRGREFVKNDFTWEKISEKILAKAIKIIEIEKNQ
jgi:glycosyltransferase involved in cell wall biosynthesis|tara:strand:- start:882 stop:2072 length:1191 start_codon:yes stop_codon:yes gene_type:complete